MNIKIQIYANGLAITLLLIMFSLRKTNGQLLKDKGNKPNIVVILAEDLGWMDVRYNGNEFY